MTLFESAEFWMKIVSFAEARVNLELRQAEVQDEETKHLTLEDLKDDVEDCFKSLRDHFKEVTGHEPVQTPGDPANARVVNHIALWAVR